MGYGFHCTWDTIIYKDNFSSILKTSLTSVSQIEIIQPDSLQPKNLEFQYGWCEGGLRTQELSATANIYGSSGFLWLLTLHPHQWRIVYIDSKIPGFSLRTNRVRLGTKAFLFWSERKGKYRFCRLPTFWDSVISSHQQSMGDLSPEARHVSFWTCGMMMWETSLYSFM